MLSKEQHKAIAFAISYEDRKLNTLSYMTGFEFSEAREVIKHITLSLSMLFTADNPQFNPQEFLVACEGD